MELHELLEPSRNMFVVSLSNHERNGLKSCALRQAQGERIIQEVWEPHT